MGVKRFDFINGTEPWMEEAALGEYVKAADYDCLQAQLDAVMLEHCPNEMTDEQRFRWAAAQRRAPSGRSEHG